MEALIKKMLASNAELLAEVRGLRKDLADSELQYIDAAKASLLMNSKNARVLQKLREQRHLKEGIDYYWQGKGFMYLKSKIVEIRNQIITGQFPIKNLKAA